MTKQPIKKKTGRPKIIIDYNLVYRLAKRFETQEGIAEIIGCSASTLQHNKEFLQAFNKGKSQVYKNLRVAQYKYAMNGNPQLLIWLGKNYLGQKDPDKTIPIDNNKDNLKQIAEAIRNRDTE